MGLYLKMPFSLCVGTPVSPPFYEDLSPSGLELHPYDLT